MPSPTRRQLLLAPFLLGVFPAKADLFPTHPATRTIAAQAGITGGTYLGQWADGQELRQILRVIGPDLITLQRQGYSSPPVPYHRIALDRFQSGNGNSLTVISATRLRWTNANGTGVIYDLE
ncbi:hypothetical protein [Nioella sp. MMSF_3534]|uniref:hypothetical protein n=1 Tax=Nioella sp. MMSF_3534 TaxID=3046720 RepID=UPI00273D6F4D|nr:hypothetical protein [Nioella sp. MMSF_3534]